MNKKKILERIDNFAITIYFNELNLQAATEGVLKKRCS